VLEVPTREKLRVKFLEVGSGFIGFLCTFHTLTSKESQVEESKLKLFILNQILSRCLTVIKDKMSASTVNQYLLSSVALLCTQTENTSSVVKDETKMEHIAVKTNCHIREDRLSAKKTSYIVKSSETVIIY